MIGIAFPITLETKFPDLVAIGLTSELFVALITSYSVCSPTIFSVCTHGEK